MSTSGAGTPGEPGQGAAEVVNAPTGTSDFDYEGGYNELRPEYTRATQELSEVTGRLSEYEALFEALNDPDRQAEALGVLGFEPAETGAPQGGTDVDTSEWTDPLEEEIKSLKEAVDGLRSQSELEAEQREQNELLELRDDYIGEAISYIEDQTGRKFSEEQERVLGNLAIANEGEDGVPDVQTAYNLLYGEKGIVELERSNWIDTKTGAFQAPGGRSAPATKKPVEMTERERVAYLDERYAQMERQQ
jgi:hypothetical protein